MLAALFLLMWLVVAGLSLLMKRPPYHRAVGAQFNMSYALILLLCAWAIEWFCKSFRLKMLSAVGLLLCTSFFFYHFIKIGRTRMAEALYQFHINRYSELLQMNLRDIPAGSSVWFSDESFYLYNDGRKKGLKTSLCSDGKEQYYIKTDVEVLPVLTSGQYKKLWERGEYRIYIKEQ